jgi:uncharacterized protein YggE
MRTRVWRLAMVAVILLAMATTAIADDKGGAGRRTIVVTGQGEVTAAPDLVVVAVAVETVAPKAADAVGENASRSAKVAAALKSLIGKDDKLTTTRYSLDPRYEQAKPGQPSEPRIIGYVAHNEVQVETHKIDSAGALLDGAIAAGANRVSSLQFTLSNRNEQLRSALERAGAEARAQAESVAKALDVKLKSVVSATTSTTPIVQPRFFEGRAMAAMAASPPTPVEPGTVSVSASLQVTYEID